MTQGRIQDYGSPTTAQSLKALTSSIITSAVLDGNDFLVDGPNRLRVNPGSAVTHQGVIILEDEPKYLNVVNTSSPVDYTVYYEHIDADISGGVPATLRLAAGLLTDAVVQGVILGYIRYPGSAVPLDQAHFIQVPKTRLGNVRFSKENSDWVVPVRNLGYMSIGAVGGPLNITDTWDISGSKPEMYVKIRNNTAASASATLVFPFKVQTTPFSLLQVVIGTDINALVTPSLIDSEGVVFMLSAVPFPNNPALQLRTVDINRETVQTPNTLIYLQLQMTIASNREVKLQAIGLNAYNLPV